MPDLVTFTYKVQHDTNFQRNSYLQDFFFFFLDTDYKKTKQKTKKRQKTQTEKPTTNKQTNKQTIFKTIQQG